MKFLHQPGVAITCHQVEQVGARDVEAPPVGIVHVLLSDLVRLGVHVYGVLGLGPHEVAPDDAALLRHLTYQHYS